MASEIITNTNNFNTRRLEGKVALVTAATAGIGYAIAQRLGKEGAMLFICSRKQSNVDDSIQQLRSAGIEVAGCACHVANGAQRKHFVQTALKTYGRVDILVSNAAVNPAIMPILETSAEAIDKIFEVNVKAAILLVKETVPHMSKGSSIVFVSSVGAFTTPLPAPIGVYAISKTALLGLTKFLAAELGDVGIRVNCIAPGVVHTKFGAFMVKTPELARQVSETNFMKRLGRPEEMAATVAFLVSDDASYITGETIVVAGGMQSHL